jgi:hypothetical protein
MKTHVEFAHPKLFVLIKVQVVEKIIVVDVNHSQQHGKKRVGHLIL